LKDAAERIPVQEKNIACVDLMPLDEITKHLDKILLLTSSSPIIRGQPPTCASGITTRKGSVTSTALSNPKTFILVTDARVKPQPYLQAILTAAGWKSGFQILSSKALSGSITALNAENVAISHMNQPLSQSLDSHYRLPVSCQESSQPIPSFWPGQITHRITSQIIL